VTAKETETADAARDHQLRTLAVAITTLASALSGVAVVIFYATSLNRLWFLHFPLGFYLLAQGLLIFIVFIAFWHVRVQERIDHTRSITEEIT
jgi:putative solute:sodium symporter small subunit